MENLIKDENYLTIQGWMINRLGLKNNELNIYAIIYGFSQTPDAEFTGSLQYLADWCNCTKQCVLNCLRSLIEKGYIVKTEMFKNNVKFCSYRVGLSALTKLNGIQKSLMGGIQKSLPNNKDIDIIEKKEKKITKEKKQKHAYGEFKHVFLTDYEYQKLNDDYGLVLAEKTIKFLDEYIEDKEYKSRSHYLAIKRWVVDALNKHVPKRQNAEQSSMCDRIARL